MKMEEKEKQIGQLNLINKESDGWGGSINDVSTLFSTKFEGFFRGEDGNVVEVQNEWVERSKRVCEKSVTSFMNHPHGDFVMK
jgi:hypothetical protein